MSTATETRTGRRTIDVDERLPVLQTIPLSLQHLFAMFGATVLVPFLFKVNPATCLLMNGVGTLIYYPVPIHKQAYLQAFVPGAEDLDLPVTNQLSDEVLAIPVHPRLTAEDLGTIVAAVRDVATPAGAGRTR